MFLVDLRKGAVENNLIRIVLEDFQFLTGVTRSQLITVSLQISIRGPPSPLWFLFRGCQISKISLDVPLPLHCFSFLSCP